MKSIIYLSKPWPINGGILNESSEDANGDLIVTG